MMPLEHKGLTLQSLESFDLCFWDNSEKMQKAWEASMRCLQGKAFPYNPQFNVSFVEGVPGVKDEVHTDSRGGIIEGDCSSSIESFAPPNEGYYGPMHLQDYYQRSTSHPYIQKAHHNQFHMVESHFYPMNHKSCFPMGNQPHYVPFVPLKMLSQSHPQDFHFQEFQYFVVIDFEATCDKEKNPHPQEIIEFPSVLVNSMTGQLEDSFQIYVRPTCNHLLSDFCKELTGIQQIQQAGHGVQKMCTFTSLCYCVSMLLLIEYLLYCYTRDISANSSCS